MTEQQIRDEFEKAFQSYKTMIISKVKSFDINSAEAYIGLDKAPYREGFYSGYSLSQETIAELESRIEQSVDISVVNELNETIKAKDAEIERLLEQQAKDSYKERAGIFDDIIEKKDKSIAEARELLLNHIAIFESQGLQWCCKKDIQEAKAWLENNK